VSESAEQPTPPRRPRSRLLLASRVAAVAVIAALVGLLVQRTLARERGPNLVAAIRADEKPQAPAFELDVIWPRTETWPRPLRGALADGEVTLTELRGYPVVINFWASWCVPCEAEAPRLVASAEAHADEVAFLGIDIQDFKSDATKFLRRYDTNYVSVRDPTSASYDSYGLTGIPETYYLDREGRVVAHSVGEVSREELEAGIAAAAAGKAGT